MTKFPPEDCRQLDEANGDTISRISTYFNSSSSADSTCEPFVTIPAAEGVAPHQPLNYDGLHYDTTSYHQLQQTLFIASDSVPTYASTTHALERCSTISPSDCATVLQSIGSSSQVDVIQESSSYINNFHPSCEISYPAVEVTTEVLDLSDTNTKCLTSINNSPSRETFEAKQAGCIPRHILPTNKTFSTCGGYSRTVHACEKTRALLRDTTGNIYEPVFDPTTILWTTHRHAVTPSCSDTLKSHVGSDAVSEMEHNPSHLVVEHILQRPQLVAWIHQRCAKTMTLSEKMEMNKHA